MHVPTIPPQTSAQSIPPPQLPPIVPPHPPSNEQPPDKAPQSPVAPEFSPITPKAAPVIPATYPPLPTNGQETSLGGEANARPDQPPSTIAPAQYIPQPPPQPFSSEDATDAIALRAAISTLQFQKKKAQDDIRALEKIRTKALNEPALFKTELAAGKLQEQAPRAGNLQSILDEADSDDDEDEVIFGASADEEPKLAQDQTGIKSDTRDEPQESKSASSTAHASSFGRIPGPQNVVRMPYVNWNKYHITGEPLDALHEQQRKWPGSFAYGQNRGREHVVAAPYSPWLDSLDTQQQGWDGERRNDSVTTPGTAVTPTSASISEHPMETRRKQMFQ